jgi:hypothetical protein
MSLAKKIRLLFFAACLSDGPDRPEAAVLHPCSRDSMDMDDDSEDAITIEYDITIEYEPQGADR